MNTFTLLGSVINPELNFTSEGLAILEMKIGVREQIGERVQVSYTRAKVFGKRAESLLQQIEDNSDTTVVFLEGRFEQYKGENGTFNSMNVSEAVVLDISNPKFWQDCNGNDLLVNGQNILTLSGNLTKDVTVRELDDGQIVVNGTIACNRKYKGKETVVFLRFTAWNGKAKILQNAKKGEAFLIKGAVTTKSYESDDGKVYYDLLNVGNVAPIQKMVKPAEPAEPAAEFPVDESLPF